MPERADDVARTLTSLHLLLDSPGPATWLATHLAARYDGEEDEASAVGPRRAVGMADVLVDDAALLRALHCGLVDDGTPPPAAATYLAGWFAGAVASAVGYGLAAGGAGFVVDAAPVRWHLHPEGWPERVELLVPGTAVVVTAAHPWAGQPGVDIADDADTIVSDAVTALARVVEPLVDACHGLAKVGRAGLWNEVGDELGMAVAHQVAVPVSPEMTAVLDAAVRVPGVPWRAKPALRFAAAPCGTVHVAQKGGCCLAYTRTTPDEDHEDDGEDADPDHLEYLARFPPVPGAPHHCTTCSFRDAADCDARQVFWQERRHRRQATAQAHG